MSLNIEKLISITIEVMMQNSLSDLSKIKVTRSKDRTNVWNQICFKYHGLVDYKNTLQFYQWWQRDTQNYSTLSKSAINELSKEPEEAELLNSKEKKIVVTFRSDEWKNSLL